MHKLQAKTLVLVIPSASLTINRAWALERERKRSCCTFIAYLSVSRSVRVSGKCTVVKRLIGCGCRLEWWVGSVEGWVYYRIVKGRAALGDEFRASNCNQWGLCCAVVRERRALPKLVRGGLVKSCWSSYYQWQISLTSVGFWKF